jgi:hypothetical protein
MKQISRFRPYLQPARAVFFYARAGAFLLGAERVLGSFVKRIGQYGRKIGQGTNAHAAGTSAPYWAIRPTLRDPPRGSP